MIRIKFLYVLMAFVIVAVFASCTQEPEPINNVFIGSGQMPSVAKDSLGNLHIVYGSSDSLLYVSSVNGGKFFSHPELVARLNLLVTSSMRGPKIAAGKYGPVIAACNKAGNIFSYTKLAAGGWLQTARINDEDTVAKEGFIAMAAAGDHMYITWLDLRGNKKNKIAGALSDDAGKSWSKNTIVYSSPDSSVCECCKPSVAMQGENVYIMFRNWLQGNRDLYLVQSGDGGNHFGPAGKLGAGNWALNGCPMDGGGLAINNKGVVETVWRRNSSIYSCEAGMPETIIGEGKGCSIETMNGKNVYAW